MKKRTILSLLLAGTMLLSHAHALAAAPPVSGFWQPTQTPQTITQSAFESVSEKSSRIPNTEIESVILQICLKEKLEKLAELGGAIPPPPPKDDRRRPKGRRSSKQSAGTRKRSTKSSENSRKNSREADHARPSGKSAKRPVLGKKSAKHAPQKGRPKKS